MAEIERKFLVSDPPDEIGTQTHIRQGYLSIEPAEVRVRSRDDEQHELTVKSVGGLTRTEVSVALTPEQFEGLWPLARSSVEKDRSTYGVGGWTAEGAVY